ncbi:sensor histidine kinase [Hyphomicrobium sp.]|uniref:sensor histidine kinase n=1 Tax=Hyphomicrobium sp. TaxID=82 RepID=UPI0025BC18A2|nr:sensor histidine kinase [Hyphomicrobium sp.]MCC7250551.1 hypothetical protein [Hyphomicrobium sp.]
MSGAGVPADLLVVDAVAERHGTYRDLLGRLAREVVTVAPGEDARQLLGADRFAAVLVNLDGAADRAPVDVAGIALGASSGPPVIVISGRMAELGAGGCPVPGAFAYVPAPLAAELLPANVACLLELARLRATLAERDGQIEALGRQVAELGVAAADEKRTADALKARVGEQIHRSKNLLTIMQSVAHRTLQGDHPLSEVRDTLAGRFRALARAHHMIAMADENGTEIADIMDAVLADISHRVTANGPPARLAHSAVQTFSLAVHELAVNAAKHGALRSPDGSVAVGWTFFEHGAERYLEVGWTERGGAASKAPSHYGFGLTLVSSFAGPGADRPCIAFEETGFICCLRLLQDVLIAA